MKDEVSTVHTDAAHGALPLCSVLDSVNDWYFLDIVEYIPYRCVAVQILTFFLFILRPFSSSPVASVVFTRDTAAVSQLVRNKSLLLVFFGNRGHYN